MAIEVPEKQVLIAKEDDNEFLWHHRLLMLPLPEPGQWVALSPDHQFERLDLSEHRVRILTRGVTVLPAVIDDAGTFLFEEFQPGELERLRQEAKEFQQIMGLAVAVDDKTKPASTWRVADTAVPSFGDEIPTAAVDDPAFFVCKGEVGLVCIDTVWTLCQLVKNEVIDEWRRKKLCGQKHDFRLAGDYVLCGNRQATFAESLERSPQEKVIAGWPMGGERAALEFTASLNTAGYTWLTHHLDFVAKSGISKGSGSCRTHRRISEALSLFAQFDFLNVVNLAGAEFLIQYLIQLETAIQRNPKAPDFTFLDEYLASGVNEAGAVMVPRYAHVVAERQRDKANTMKQQRLWAEEQDSRRRQGGDPKGRGGDPKGRGRGKKGKSAEDADDDA